MRGSRRVGTFVLVSLILAATAAVAVPQAAIADGTVTINGNDSGRTFDGFGATSGGASTSRLLYDYSYESHSTQQQEILDYLFCSPFHTPVSGYCTSNIYGAALQELKVEIGSDTGSIGAEPAFARTQTELTNMDNACQSQAACNLTASLCNTSRGYEWWLMKQAKNRDPDIKLYALAWGWPAYIGAHNDTLPSTDYRKYYWKVFAQDQSVPAANDAVDYLTRYVQCAGIVNGTSIDYIGMWNEKGEFSNDLDSGKGTTWDITTPEWWITRLHDSLSDWGLSTKVVAFDNGWSPIDTVMGSCTATWCQDVYALGSHYTDGNGTSTANGLGKPLWDSESGDPANYQTNPIQMADWGSTVGDGAQAFAQAINQYYINGHVTKVDHFSALSSYYDVVYAGEGLMYANQPWSGWYKVQSRIWVMAQVTQFAQPGTWRYIDSASCYIGGQCAPVLCNGNCPSDTLGTYATLRSISGSDWSIIVETINATASQNETFCITPNQGLTSSGMVHGWLTNSTNSLNNVANYTLNGNHCFTASLSPNSLYTFTTTTGQVKGTSTPPASQAFPFPYNPNFDAQTVGNAPLDFMDMQGAFEVAYHCVSNTYNCVQQVTLARPNDWWGNPGAGRSDGEGGPRPAPYSLIGDQSWGDYGVYAGINTPNVGDSVSLWARAQTRRASGFVDGSMPAHFEFTLTKINSTQWQWRLASINYQELPSGTNDVVYSTGGTVNISAWTDATIKVSGHTISAILSGSQIASFTPPSTRVDYGWTTGQAGVSSIKASLTDPQPADLSTLGPQYNGGQFSYFCIGSNPTQSGCQ